MIPIHVRRWPAVLAALTLIALIPRPAAAATAADAPRITVEEVKKLAAKGEVVIVDVRDKSAYDFEHIPGAVSIPYSELDARIAELPKDKNIASYCTCVAEGTSAVATKKLIEKGYGKAAAIKDGLAAWKEAGGETASTPTKK
jgi:rhodanese-related sulfurtransferase